MYQISWSVTVCVCKSVCLNVNPLTLELPQHGVPRPGAPRRNIILTVFEKFPSQYFGFMGINQRLQAGISALQKFVTVGEAGFSALRG